MPIHTLSQTNKTKKAHEIYTDCVVESEIKCMGKAISSTCPSLNISKSLGGRPNKFPELTATEKSRLMNLCSSRDNLNNFNRDELIRIANLLGIRGISRIRKADICHMLGLEASGNKRQRNSPITKSSNKRPKNYSKGGNKRKVNSLTPLNNKRKKKF